MSSGGPRTDDVIYRGSPARVAVSSLAIGLLGPLVGWLAVTALLSIQAGRLTFPPAPLVLLFVGVFAAGFTVLALLAARGRPAELKFGAAGLEMAAAGRDGFHVPYKNVTDAQVRAFWPVAALDVFVLADAADRIKRVNRDGTRPMRRRKGEMLRLTMPIGGLPATPAEVRAELTKRGLTQASRT